MKARHEVEDQPLDAIQLAARPGGCPVLLRLALLEALEEGEHLGTVVRLVGVPRHVHATTNDPDGVADLPEAPTNGLRVLDHRPEARRGHIACEVRPQSQERAPLQGAIPKAELEGGDRLAVALDDVDHRALALVMVAELVHLHRTGPQPTQLCGEGRDDAEGPLVLEVGEDLLAVADDRRVIEVTEVERGEVVLLAPGRERGHQLVEVQVREACRLLEVLGYDLPHRREDAELAHRLPRRPSQGRRSATSRQRLGRAGVSVPTRVHLQVMRTVVPSRCTMLTILTAMSERVIAPGVGEVRGCDTGRWSVTIERLGTTGWRSWS